MPGRRVGMHDEKRIAGFAALQCARVHDIMKKTGMQPEKSPTQRGKGRGAAVGDDAKLRLRSLLLDARVENPRHLFEQLEGLAGQV